MSSDQHGLGMQKGEIFRHNFCLDNLQADFFFNLEFCLPFLLKLLKTVYACRAEAQQSS